jgi:hypothetical protein
VEKQAKPAASPKTREPLPILTEEDKKTIQILNRLARESAAETEFTFLGLTTST